MGFENSADFISLFKPLPAQITKKVKVVHKS